MFRNMVTSLLKHNKIRTTQAKAKELRRWADKIITLAKRGDLHARRQALSIVREKDVVHQLFEQAEERFGDIHGGYTRIVKLGHRAGDAAKMTMIEVLDKAGRDDKKKKKKVPQYETPTSAPVDAKPDEPEAAPEVDADAETVEAAPEVDADAETVEAAPEADAETVEVDAISEAETEVAPEPEAEAAVEESESTPEEPEPAVAEEEKPAVEEEAPKTEAPETGEKPS